MTHMELPKGGRLAPSKKYQIIQSSTKQYKTLYMSVGDSNNYNHFQKLNQQLSYTCKARIQKIFTGGGGVQQNPLHTHTELLITSYLSVILWIDSV